jgi:predicted PurR-regulated permease PerM
MGFAFLIEGGRFLETPSNPRPPAPEKPRTVDSLAPRTAPAVSLRAPSLFTAVALAVILIYYGAPVLLPFLLAVFLFLMLEPIVASLEKRRIPRVVGAVLAVTASVCILSATGLTFYISLKKMADKIPTYSEKISLVARSLHGTASRLAMTTEVLLDGKVPATPGPVDVAKSGSSSVKVSEAESKTVAAPPSSPVRSMAPYLVRGLTSVVSLLSWIFFIPLISFFFLLEKVELSARIRRLIGDTARYEVICHEMKEMAHGFFLGNFVVFFFMTAAFAGVFYALGLDTAFQLALFAGLLNLVPVFGVVLGAVLPASQAFLQFDGFGPIAAVLIASLVIHFIGNNIIMPKFLGNRVNVNASSAMIGFLFWGALWGAPGLFLAIPLMASLRIFLASSARWRASAELISQTPVPLLSRLGYRQVFRRSSGSGRA